MEDGPEVLPQETEERPLMSEEQLREAVEHLARAPRRTPDGMSEIVLRSWKLPDPMLSPEDQRLEKRVKAEVFRKFGWDKRRSERRTTEQSIPNPEDL